MLKRMYYITLLALTLSLIDEAHCMECYVCTEQEGNDQKCLTTVRTCAQDEDTCMTDIRWGSTPYWSQGAEKQYYVTKNCANRTYCEQRRQELVKYCHRIWYEDWKCAECCRGDRCNYYVVLGAADTKANIMFIAGSTILALILIWRN